MCLYKTNNYSFYTNLSKVQTIKIYYQHQYMSDSDSDSDTNASVIYEIYSYTKALIRPSSEYFHVFKKYVFNSESTNRIGINQSTSLLDYAYNYFIHPIHIQDKIYLGNLLNSSNYEQLKSYGFDVIFNMTAEHACYFKDEFEYHKLEVSDLNNVIIGDHFNIMVDKLHDSVVNGKTILVHCHHGRSRSVALITGYLMKYFKLSFESAYQIIKNKKPIVNINADFRTQLIKLYPCH